MTDPGFAATKLEAAERVKIPVAEAVQRAVRVFCDRGLGQADAEMVAAHLAEADASGVESHGMVRVLQYAREFETGRMDPRADVTVTEAAPNRFDLDAGGGIGIPAMRRAVMRAARAAGEQGLAMATLRGAGHTGRLGAFAEEAARGGCLTIILGGGDRHTWRMVAPYGGRKALLPTNPYCFGIPGGARGPVVADFATSQIAGGWIYAARASGAPLPAGAVIDTAGRPTRDPEDYFAGGAILPKGGAMGYGLAVLAELVGEAMLGPVDRGEINWLVLCVDCRNYRAAPAMQEAAEAILAELRDCPPAEGHDRVNVPGEMERDRASAARDMLHLPAETWARICAL
jgi:LDH2 family malate/lactate/ureidoglycolate dehydrogenase